MMPDDFNPNMPEPVEELDEPDYDLELHAQSQDAAAEEARQQFLDWLEKLVRAIAGQ